MTLSIILSGLAIILFFIYFFYTGAKRSSYLIYIVICMPVMDLWVSPAAYGPLKVFDVITFSSVFLLNRDFTHLGKRHMIYLYLFLILMSLLFFGSMASQFPFQSIYGVLKAIPPFIFARSLIMELTKNEDFLSKIIMALKIACLTGVFFIVMQMTIGLDFTFYEALNSNVSGEGQLRYPGFFPDSQFSGVYLSMLSFLFLLNLKDPKKPTVVNYVSFGLVVLAIILAGSRSAMLGFGAGLFLLIVFVGGRFRITAILFGTAVAVVVGIFANSFVIFRRFGEMDDSISFRQTIWRGAYDIFKDNYLLGIGVSNYRAYVSLHAQDQFLMLENEQLVYLDQPENGYLKLLVEFGLLGFITLFAIVLGPIIKLFITFLQGRKKVISGFFFVAPLICLFLSFSSLYTLSDSRIVILLCCFVAFLITYPSDYQPAHEI